MSEDSPSPLRRTIGAIFGAFVGFALASGLAWVTNGAVAWHTLTAAAIGFLAGGLLGFVFPQFADAALESFT